LEKEEKERAEIAAAKKKEKEGRDARERRGKRLQGEHKGGESQSKLAEEIEKNCKSIHFSKN